MLCTHLSYLVYREGVERGKGRGWPSRRACDAIFEPCNSSLQGGRKGFIMRGETLFRRVGRR